MSDIGSITTDPWAIVAETERQAQIRRRPRRKPDANPDLVVLNLVADPCPLCAPWQGRVLSMSGRSKRFPSVGDARAAGCFHPRCRHHPELYRPGQVPRRPSVTAATARGQVRARHADIERRLRMWRRREAAALDDTARDYARGYVRKWTLIRREFRKANGLDSRGRPLAAREAAKARATRRTGRLAAQAARSAPTPKPPTTPRIGLDEARRIYTSTSGGDRARSQAVIEALGYADRPTVAPLADVMAAADRGPTGVLRRHVTEAEHADEFRRGSYYVGDGISGTGTYTVEGSAEDFTAYIDRTFNRSGGETLTMTLDEGARVLDVGTSRDLGRWADSFADEYGELADDPSLIAALQGYDAIRITRSREVFVIIINRGRVIVASR